MVRVGFFAFLLLVSFGTWADKGHPFETVRVAERIYAWWGNWASVRRKTWATT